MKVLKLTHAPAAGDVQAVVVIRNEMLRLPGFLRHHRALGIRRFIFVDNNSDDGTTQYLLDQPDATVLHTDAPYGDRSAGQRKWVNDALQKYCVDRWALVLDADELFVYDACETKDIGAFCGLIEAAGARGLFAFLLDMYPVSYDDDAQAGPLEDLVAAAPCFDSDYQFMRRHDGPASQFPDIVVRGGPRDRLLRMQRSGSPWGRVRSFAQTIQRDALRRVWPSQARQLESRVLFHPPELGKVPLIKVARGFELSRGGHFSTPLSLFTRNGVLLHFKLMHDYVTRLQQLARAGQHWNGSLEQRWLLNALSRRGGRGLLYEGTCRYTDSRQLANQSILRDIRPYSNLALIG